jgi:hypothetical protein
MELVFKLVSFTGASGNRQYLFDARDSGGVNGAYGLFYDKGFSVEKVGSFNTKQKCNDYKNSNFKKEKQYLCIKVY